MKTKIVPADELSTKTLRARDYVLKKFKVTITEETEIDAVIQLPAEDLDEAWEQLVGMYDDELMKLVKGNKTDFRVLNREVTSLDEENDEDTKTPVGQALDADGPPHSL